MLARHRTSALLLVAAALLLGLLFWRPSYVTRIDVAKLQHVGGQSYYLPLPRPWLPLFRLAHDSAESPRTSKLIVYEGGQVLGPAHQVHATILEQGRGRYSHWGTGLYLSPSDRSDPRTNGRTYELRSKLQLTPAANAIALFGLLASLFALILRHTREITTFGQKLIEIPGAGTALKTLSLIGMCLLAPFAWFGLGRHLDLLWTSGRLGALAIYALTATLAIAGTAVVPFLGSWRWRAGLGVVIVLGFAADQAVSSLSGAPLTLDMMRTLWREKAQAGSLMGAYAAPIAITILLAVALFGIIALPPVQHRALSGRVILLPVGALVSGLLLQGYAEGLAVALPAPIAVPGQLAIVTTRSSLPNLERRSVEYNRAVKPLFRKIVIVVDESVRGDYLGLNNPSYDNTPFLVQARDRLINFGTATSAANCSAAARLMMRVGLQKHQLPDTAKVFLTLPTIWQYAKQAGLGTVLIDGWTPPGVFHSYMNKAEEAFIDEQQPSIAMPEYGRDAEIAKRLVDVLKQDKPMLIYVNKHGIHMDWRRRYPPDATYEPRPVAANAVLPGPHREMVGHYHKAVHWAVDRFFRDILQAADREDTLLIYTSDHGQALFEGGYDTQQCSLSRNVHVGEVRVPLFMLTGSKAFEVQMRASAKPLFDRASHFDLFPTILIAMGYSRDWAEKVYGPSLFNTDAHRKRGFLLGTFIEPGAVWIDVD